MAITIIETIANATILCGRSGYGYGDRCFRNKRSRACLAGTCRHIVHGAACSNRHHRSRSRSDRNRERLRDGLRLGASTSSVARDIRDDTLYLDRGHVYAGANLRNTYQRELGCEYRNLIHTRGVTQPLRDIHGVLIRRGGRSCRKRGGDNRRLNFVATHIIGVLIWPTYYSSFPAPVAIGSDSVFGPVFKIYSSLFLIGRL